LDRPAVSSRDCALRPAAIGVIVVWTHHVGKIVGGPDARGDWLVHSGNDGNAVKTRYRSLSRAVAFRRL
jgi:hypothetical protein